MRSVYFLVGIFVPFAYGAGEFLVLHHPKSVVFKSHEVIKESLLKEVYSAAVGFTTQQDTNWQGMYLSDPFHLAEALVIVEVDGVATLGTAKGHRFPLRTDEEADSTYNALEKRIKEHSPSDSNNLVHIDLSEGITAIEKYEIFSGIKNAIPESYVSGNLKASVEEDRLFLEEVAMLNAVADRIESGVVKRDYKIDVFWFKIAGLHAVSDLHGENSTSTKEAKQILTEAILKLNEAYKRVYNGAVLTTIIVSDASHTRTSRSLMQANEETKAKADDEPKNLAKNYNENYPVMFNIMLWYGVLMVFTLMAICMFIGNMDPGRDSIIYRMTSTRIKKDN